MCIWTNTGDIYSTECGQFYPVDGHIGKYCRHCSTLITERRQGMTPGPWIVGTRQSNGLFFVEDGSSVVCMMDGGDEEANARAIAKLPEIIEAGRNWLDCRNLTASTTEAAATRFREILDEAEGVQ